MHRFLRFYPLLLLLITASPSRAQHYFSKEFTPESYRFLTLHQPPTFFDILLNRYTGSQIAVPADFYRPGFTAFEPYLNLTVDYPDLDTVKARSNLNLMLGSERDQLLFIDHHQNLGKGFSGGLHYHSIVSPGFVRSQLAKNKGFGIFLATNQSHYAGKISFSEAKVTATENGGIIDTVITDIPSRSELEVIPVNLTGASSIQRKQQVELLQHLFLKDSLGGLQIHLAATLDRQGRSYRESASVSELYPVTLDTVSTYDTSFFNVGTIAPSVSYTLRSDSVYKIEVNAGIRYRYAEDRIAERRRKFDWQEFTWGGIFAFQQHLLELKGTIAAGNSFNGNFNAEAKYLYARKSKFFSSIALSAYAVKTNVALSDQYFSSNHFQWSNDFSKENYVQLKGETEFMKDHFFFSVASVQYDNKVVFTEEGMPEQLASKRSVTQLSLTAKTELGKVNFLGYAVYRPEVFKEYPLPETELYARIAFHNRYFKSALNAEGGFSALYTSEFFAPWYDPATGRYRTQQVEKVGNTPVLNAFVNLRIKSATISVMMENIGYGWLGDQLYTGPRNPAAPRILRLAVNWLLTN